MAGPAATNNKNADSVKMTIANFHCHLRGKYLSENAGSEISECLDFQIFWGSIPSDPKALTFSAPFPGHLLLFPSLLLQNLLKALNNILLTSRQGHKDCWKRSTL